MTDHPGSPLDEGVLRALVPRVLAGMVRRGEDFDAAEDALQEALLEALRVWPEHPPRDPRAWLTTVATRRLVDARRSEAARLRREDATRAVPPPAVEEGDDTLFLLFCCCHPDLAPTSQVALTLRAVGGLTTREIADAFYVPEPTMAQRISRAKRALQGRRLDQPGDLAVVLRVLYLIYTAGHGGRVDLAGEAIRLARQLTLATEEPEARGLLALMLLNHARLPARYDADGRIVTLDQQDRGLWDTRQIAEGVRVLQQALAVGRPGRYQIEAAIAALHDDAATAEETDWPQVLAWYDDLVALTEEPVRQDPAAVLARAVAVGHVLGGTAGLRETDRLREVLGERHRWHAVRGYLHELSGDLDSAGAAYAEAARRATDVAERDHLVRQAARVRSAAAHPEEPLAGGNMAGAVRVGATVRRAAGAWSPTIQRLLRHLHDEGLTWVPEPLGRDEQGRDTVSHLPGVVPQYPLPGWIWTEAVLLDAARHLAELHDATSGLDTTGASWQLPAHQPAEVICHNDFAPYNMVFTDGRLTGVIDWDTASPGPRVWDLAYLAYRLVPLTDPANHDAPATSLRERSHRLLLLCDAYGHDVRSADVLEVTERRLEELAAFTQARAEEGNGALRSHVDLYRRDARWVAAHLDRLASGQDGPSTGR